MFTKFSEVEGGSDYYVYFEMIGGVKTITVTNFEEQTFNIESPSILSEFEEVMFSFPVAWNDKLTKVREAIELIEEIMEI